MGFPPSLVPHINCEPRRPLPTERWDWVVCRNALWVNRLCSAIYPYHTWGQRPQSPPSSSCPKARKMLHRASVPETGTLAVFPAHRSPEGDLHVIRSLAPNLWGPKTRAPPTFRGRLMLTRRPHSRVSAPATSHRILPSIPSR
jgi:hypothetical protein